MIGSRVFSSSIRRSGLSWSASQKPWSYYLSSSTRAMSSIKTPLGPTSPQKPSPFADPALISKRFFQSGGNSNSSSSSTFSSKLFAAVGLLFGIGSGAAYHAMADKDSLFGKYYLAACAEGNNCGCGPKCVEKKCDNALCLRAKECEEELIIKANADLEKALKDTKGKAIEYTEAAMKAYCEAISFMCEYLENGYSIIGEDELEPPQYEEAWCCLYNVAKKRCEKVKAAIEKGQCAWELLCRLREVIENGKACKYTSCNPLICTAEEALTCAERELLDLKAKMDCVRTDHDMAKDYKSAIASFRSDLKSDVDRLIQDMGCEVQFVEQEVALQILQAYKRVLRVQKEVAQALVCKGKVPERLAKTCC